MSEMAVQRVKESLDAVPPRIEQLRKRAEASHDPAEKSFCADQIRQLQAYQAELSHYSLELPTITFDKTYLLQDPAYDLHLEFHGHAHTAGDIFVFCPKPPRGRQRRRKPRLAAQHGRRFSSRLAATIDEVAKADFKYVLGGHGPMRPDRIL